MMLLLSAFNPCDLDRDLDDYQSMMVVGMGVFSVYPSFHPRNRNEMIGVLGHDCVM